MSMSIDYFAELGQDRVLSINLDSLRETFQMKAKEVHPDRGGDESDFDRLNHANSILSDPSRRIEHLYELLFASTIDSSGSLSSLATDLFGTLEPIISRADAMIKKKEPATTEIQRALIARESIEVQKKLIEANGIIRSRIQGIVDSFGEIDASIKIDKGSGRERMQISARDLAFLGKWEHEVMMRMRSLI